MPLRLNRRRFISASAAASWAISHGIVEGAIPATPLKVAVVGLGGRGTNLLRTLLEIEGVEVAVVCDTEPKHRTRAQGIIEKTRGVQVEGVDRLARVLDRPEVDAVISALPCDLHASTYVEVIRAGKHLYGEKPLALTLEDCDLVAREAARAPRLQVHVGYQRRSNPRFAEGVALLQRGELGRLLSSQGAWLSSNGPLNGHQHWLAQRRRSGDWMVEQAVHVWDVLGWLKGSPPVRAFGTGRRDVFTHLQPDRDVTDHYTVQLDWADGFWVSFTQSWVVPADDAFTGITQQVVGEAGGLDFATGSVTFRDRSRPRQTLHAGPQADTRMALERFVAAVRSPEPLPPPLSLAEARQATAIGLLVRKAVDERRVVTWDEIVSGS